MVVGGFTPLCAKKIHRIHRPECLLAVFFFLAEKKNSKKSVSLSPALTYSSIATKMLNVKLTTLFNTEGKYYLGRG